MAAKFLRIFFPSRIMNKATMLSSKSVRDLTWLITNWNDIELYAADYSHGTMLIPYHEGRPVKVALKDVRVASSGSRMFNNKVDEYRINLNLGRDKNSPIVDKLVQIDELAEKAINEMAEDDDLVYKPILQKNSFHRITSYSAILRSKFTVNESRSRGVVNITHVLNACLFDNERRTVDFTSKNLATYIDRDAKVNTTVEIRWFVNDSGVKSSLWLSKIRRLSPVEEDNECDI